ncbi:41870_t:CDS:2, partial [Gigaspora margarita]
MQLTIGLKSDLRSSEPSLVTTLSPSLSFSSSPLFSLPFLSSTLLFLNINTSSSNSSLLVFFAIFAEPLSNFNIIFEDAATVNDVSGTFDVEATAAIIASVDDVGSFAAIVVSDVIGVFDLASVAGFDNMGIGAFDDVGISAFDDVDIGAFEDTTDLMF